MIKTAVKRMPGFVTLTEHYDNVDSRGRPSNLFEGLPRSFPAKNFLGVTHGAGCSLVSFKGVEAFWVRETAEKVMGLLNEAERGKRE